MAIDMDQVKGLTADTKEFAVLVQKNRVTESVAQLYFHDSRGKGLGVGMLDGLH